MKVRVGFQENDSSFSLKVMELGEDFDADVGELSKVREVWRGATFIPAVSTDGVISWTNDGDLPNPSEVNIRGPQGPQGVAGQPGKDGKDGQTGPAGEPGADGKDGANGVSCTHRWSGTTLYVTSASGTSSANLKGETGATGQSGSDGRDGVDGTPCTHRWSGTTLYVTSASGTTSANLKGDKGDKGDTGAAGKTPTKGTDYFTPADKAEMVAAVVAALPVYDGSVTSV